MCELHLNSSVIKKECIPRLLDIVIFQEKQCPRIRLAACHRKPLITVDFIRKVSFCVDFVFTPEKKKRAGSLGPVPWLLRITKETQAFLSPSCTLPACGFYCQGQFIVQDGCWSASPLILLPDTGRRKEGSAKGAHHFLLIG